MWKSKNDNNKMALDNNRNKDKFIGQIMGHVFDNRFLVL